MDCANLGSVISDHSAFSYETSSSKHMVGPVIRLDRISHPGANPNWEKGSSRVLKPGLGGASWPGTKKNERK